LPPRFEPHTALAPVSQPVDDTQRRLAELADFDHALLSAQTQEISGVPSFGTASALGSEGGVGLSLMSPCTQFGYGPSQNVVAAPEDPAELLQAAALHRAEELARHHFGWPKLKSFQRRAVEAWAVGRSCFVLSGTGSGKSACFTLPALIERQWHVSSGGEGFGPVALIVSPLVSLMHDQAKRLNESGVPALVCSPQGGESRWDHVVAAVRGGQAALIFMSPERAVKEAEKRTLGQLGRISVLAIDEAHCVSEWGHDFREEYSQLSRVLAALSGTGRGGGSPPVLALTATCKEGVRHDVMRSLSLEGAEHVTGTMNRPNLRFEAEEFADKAAMVRRIRELFDAQDIGDDAAVARRRSRRFDTTEPSYYSPTVIYCRRKQDADDVAQLLSRGGVHAEAFHAGHPPARRWDVQDRFTRNDIQAVAATVAFGMGIDKPDVRRVLHFGMPKSLEAYMQESGRAGRDSKPGTCIVLYTKNDRNQYEQVLLGQESLVLTPALHRSLMRYQSSFFYCRNRRQCRRAQLLQYLGEEPCSSAAFRQICTSQAPPNHGTPGFCALIRGELRCDRCDNCCGLDEALFSNCQDAGEDLQLLLRFLISAGRSGRAAAVTALRKSTGRSRRSEDDWHRVMDYAIHHGLVRLEISFGPENRQKRKAFASPQLTDAGLAWLQTAPRPFFVDFGHAAPAGHPNPEPVRSERSPLPETLNSIADPPSPGSAGAEAVVVTDDDEEIDTPEDDRPLTHLQVLVEQRRVSSQPTPQRQRRRFADDAPEDVMALQGELTAEVAALQSLVAGLEKPKAPALAAVLSDLRRLRSALEAEAPSPAKRKQRHSNSTDIRSPSPPSSSRPEAKCRRTLRAGLSRPEETSARTGSGPAAPQERALVPRQPGSAQTTLLQRPAPRAAPKAPASKKFSERDREGCSELLKQLMDAHDYTGNQTGGSEKFRQLVNQAKQLAPLAKRHILEEVPQKYYLASTPGRHRQRLAQIIAEWKAEGL